MEYVIMVFFIILLGILFLGLISSFQRDIKSRNSYLEYKRRNEEKSKIDHTGFMPYTQEWKNQHLKWAEEGLCSECGAPSGEEKGICDKCRWS